MPPGWWRRMRVDGARRNGGPASPPGAQVADAHPAGGQPHDEQREGDVDELLEEMRRLEEYKEAVEKLSAEEEQHKRESEKVDNKDAAMADLDAQIKRVEKLIEEQANVIKKTEIAGMPAFTTDHMGQTFYVGSDGVRTLVVRRMGAVPSSEDQAEIEQILKDIKSVLGY